MAEPTTPIAPRIVSVNVGQVRTLEWRGRQVTTGIWKDPVEGPVLIAGVNVDGDDQADRRVHGGPDKAVYAYADEDYRWWEEHAAGSFGPGTFGENLTTVGLDLTGSAVGDRWSVGTAVLEVVQPREPCFKLGIRMGDDGFPDRFEQAGRPGAYLRILTEGQIAAGDAVTVDAAASPRITLGQLVSLEQDRTLLEAIAGDHRMVERWRHHAQRRLRS